MVVWPPARKFQVTRANAPGFEAGTIAKPEYLTSVAVSPLNDTPNVSLDGFQATPGSRPNPGEMSTTPETGEPLLSTSTAFTAMGLPTMNMLFHATRKRPLLLE